MGWNLFRNLFSGDINTLSVGTLAHLYKLLYWSKPNGKSIVPENLLRFNCDIIVSEVRNYKKVVKAVTEGQDLQVIKDNVSRYVYSLKECQLYFNNMPHENDIDLGNIKTFTNYTMQFDYKYSSVKLERFIPDGNGFGEYIGYDSGAIWKVGNKQDRAKNEDGSIDNSDMRSVPSFEIDKSNVNINENGITNPFVLSSLYNTEPTASIAPGSDEEDENEPSLLDKFKKESIDRAKKLASNIQDTVVSSVTIELQTFINKKTAILNKELNKISSTFGIDGINPPKNIYTDDKPGTAQRIWFDVRGQLLNFTGDSVGDLLGGGGFTGGQNLQK